MTIDVGRLRIGRLLIDPAVTGRRHLLTLDSRIRIDEGRAQVTANAGTIRAPGFAGGDAIAPRARRGAGGEQARSRSAAARPGRRLRRRPCRDRQADRRAAARPRQLGELAGPRAGDARRAGLRRPRRHRPRRHLHGHRADAPRPDPHRPGPAPRRAAASRSISSARSRIAAPISGFAPTAASPRSPPRGWSISARTASRTCASPPG